MCFGICVHLCVCVLARQHSPCRYKPWVRLSPAGLSPRLPVQLSLNECPSPLGWTNYPCHLSPVSSTSSHLLAYPSVSLWISFDKVNSSLLRMAKMLMSGAFSLKQLITITFICCRSVQGSRALAANSIHRGRGGL